MKIKKFKVVDGSIIEIAHEDIIEYKEGEEIISTADTPPAVNIKTTPTENSNLEVPLEKKEDARTIKQKKKAANKKLALVSTLAFVLFLAEVALGLLYAVLVVELAWNTATSSSSPGEGSKVRKVGIAAVVLLFLAFVVFIIGLALAASTTLS